MKGRPLTVLHVTAPAEAGGLERVVTMLARGHRTAGIDVHVAAVVPPGRADHPFLEGLRAARVPCDALETPSRAYRRERGAVVDACRRLRPDVVHTHGYRADVVALAAARAAGVAAVSTVHGFTGGGWKNQLYERLQVGSLKRAAAVVAVSRPLGEELRRRGVGRERLHVLPNAWQGEAPLDAADARRLLGAPPGAFHVGWVGRLSREKGADVLLDALPHLADLPVHVSFVGDGGEGERLRRRATRLGVAGRVSWRGAVPEAGRLFRAFDVFALTSRTEGTPIVLFEAMAAGTPVVATAVGGVPDVLSGRGALLVPPCRPEALAEALRSVWLRPAEAADRAEVAGAWLRRRYAPEPWLAAYGDLYRAIGGAGETPD